MDKPFLCRRNVGTKLITFFSALLICSLLLFVTGVLSHNVAADDGEITAQQGKYLGGNMFNAVVLISHSMGSAIEPISILFVEAIISLAAKVFPEQLGQYTESLGFMNNTTISLFIILLFILLKIPKSMLPTRIFGVAIGDIENKVMGVFNFALPFLIFFNSAEYASTGVNPTETAGMAIVSSGVVTAGKIVICTLIGLAMVGSYFIMRTVTYAADVLATTLVPIPFASLIIETVKTVTCFVIVLIAVFAPYLMIGLYVVMFILCVIFFRKAYVVSRYFRKIYVAPLFTGVATKSRIAVELKNKYKENGEAEITAFAGMDIGHNIKKYSKCKLVVREGNVYLSNPKLRKLDPNNKGEMRLAYSEKTPFKIRKGMRFIEIYIEDPNDAKTVRRLTKHKRQFSIVISNTYSEFYNDLVRIIGFKAVYAEDKRADKVFA